jgi:hypothetical protein
LGYRVKSGHAASAASYFSQSGKGQFGTPARHVGQYRDVLESA